MRDPNSQFAASWMSRDSPVSAQRPVMPVPIFVRSSSKRERDRLDDELAAERDGDELLAVDDEHATVVVIDQGAQLGCDLVADLADVVQAVELAAQALQHLHVRDRAHVALVRRCIRALARLFVVEHDLILAARLRRHHRRLGARGQLARVHRVLGAERDADRDGERADAGNLELAEPLHEALGDMFRIALVAGAHDHAELFAAQPADDVIRPHADAERVGERAEQLVADPVTVHVVDALEVVDVEHQDRDGLVRSARVLQRGEQPLVEAAVVEEAGQGVRLRLMLEARANLRVVECECGRIGEAPARGRIRRR